MDQKVAIVTASATGIGKAIVYELASRGCRVVVTSRDLNHIEPVVADLISKGRDAIGIVCDVSKKEDRANLIQKTMLKYGKINYLVCNAVVGQPSRKPFDAPDDKIRKLWDINYHSVFEIVRDALPHLKKQTGSSILIMSSILGYESISKLSFQYSVSKTALIGLTKTLAHQLLANDIRVNAIAPGLIKTKLSSYAWGTEQKQQATKKLMGVKRLGVPEDVAKVARFLLSDDASYVTGQCLGVAGRPLARL